MSGSTARRWIASVRGDRWNLLEDTVVREANLEIRDASGPLAALACTPLDVEELVLGFLYTHGAIEGRHVVTGIAVDDEGAGGPVAATVAFSSAAAAGRARHALAHSRFVVSGCGQASNASAAIAGAAANGNLPAPSLGPILPKTIACVARMIQGASPVFAETGGVHASALVRWPPAPAGPDAEPELMVLREDIGRHNTVDKVIGWCLGNGVSMADKGIVVTGRISADLAAKAAAAGLPVVVSRSAPTEAAIEMAEETGTTLVGFARHDRFNVYSNWWRIGLPPRSGG